MVTVPLPGWGKGDIETIVEGLSTGDWTSFTQLTEGSFTQLTEGREDDGSVPGSSSDTPQEVFRGRRRFRGLWGFLEGIRGILWSLFVLWFLVQGVQAQAEGEGLQVVLRDSSARPENAVLLTGWDGCDGSVLWEVAKVIVLGNWSVLHPGANPNSEPRPGSSYTDIRT